MTVRSRWVLPMAAAQESQVQREALLDLLERSLRRGHRRLALRHYMMLRVRGHAVPAALREAADGLAARCAPRERRAIAAAVHAWAAMLTAPDWWERARLREH